MKALAALALMTAAMQAHALDIGGGIDVTIPQALGSYEGSYVEDPCVHLPEPTCRVALYGGVGGQPVDSGWSFRATVSSHDPLAHVLFDVPIFATPGSHGMQVRPFSMDWFATLTSGSQVLWNGESDTGLSFDLLKYGVRHLRLIATLEYVPGLTASFPPHCSSLDCAVFTPDVVTYGSATVAVAVVPEPQSGMLFLAGLALLALAARRRCGSDGRC